MAKASSREEDCPSYGKAYIGHMPSRCGTQHTSLEWFWIFKKFKQTYVIIVASGNES